MMKPKRKTVAEHVAARIAANQQKVQAGFYRPTFADAAHRMAEVKTGLPTPVPDTLADSVRVWLRTHTTREGDQDAN